MDVCIAEVVVFLAVFTGTVVLMGHCNQAQLRASPRLL